MTRVFISYRRDDTGGYALLIFDRLVNHFGRGRVFMDIDTIEPGVDFMTVIEQAVGSCDALIALIGKQWLTISDDQERRRLDLPEDFVRLEIEAALRRDIRLIPVLVRGASMPSSDDLPESLKALARRNAIDLSDERADYDMKRLIEVLQRTPSRTDVPPSWLDRLERIATTERVLTRAEQSERRTLASPPRNTRRLFEPQVVTIPAGPPPPGASELVPELAAYDLGKYPVKVLEFRAFVNENGYNEERFWTPDGWRWRQGTIRRHPDFWNEPPWTENDWYPVVGVTWYEAYAYCEWLASRTGRPYRLPTSLEWEKAARGPDALPYPWGDQPDESRCNTYATGIRQTTQVDRFSPGGDSAYGVADMIGNVAEWCLTRWSADPSAPPNDDPGGEVTRVLRGGSWSSVGIPLASDRSRAAPDTSNNFTGFRVACRRRST